MEVSPVQKALNKAYLKIRPDRASIDKFKQNLIVLMDTIANSPQESEEFLKNAGAADKYRQQFRSQFVINRQ